MTSFNFSKKYSFSSLVPTVTLIYSGISYKAMGLTITPCFIKLVNKSFASKLPLKDMKFPWDGMHSIPISVSCWCRKSLWCEFSSTLFFICSSSKIASQAASWASEFELKGCLILFKTAMSTQRSQSLTFPYAWVLPGGHLDPG